MIQVITTVEFDDDSHTPNWIHGESFDYRDFLPAVPPVGTKLNGIKDRNDLYYTIRVYLVVMSMGDPVVRIYGKAV